MEDLLKDFKKKYHLDDINAGISTDHHKENTFKENIGFKIERNEFDEKYLDECLNSINSVINNEKLIVCYIPVIRFETNVYSVDDTNSIETITEHLNENKFVLLYSPIVVDGVLKYTSRLL